VEHVTTWISAINYPRSHPIAALAKRAIDVVLALLLLAVLWPVLLVAMLLVRLTSPGPALFVQRRIGYRCAEFPMYKLRTMVNGADRVQDTLAQERGGTFLKIKDDPRTTPVGRFLRKYSIDELPQLFNVLLGDMSLVGPRPLLVCDLVNFPRDSQMRRFSMKPGITGLWQVSGRSSLPDAERLRLDLEYLDRWSLGLDLLIFARTLPVVVTAKGAT
jgi:lipopolysaccharide/colanic/teichoic acid biosynthesis glycosyltransferase